MLHQAYGIGTAPHTLITGLFVRNKSYWAKRTVLGRVLGGLRNPKSICGWLGPLPAPTGKDQNGVDIQGWISLNARRLDIPVPIVRLPKPLEALGFTETGSETNEQIINAIVDPNEYIISSGPLAQTGGQRSIFKGISLELIPTGTLLPLAPHLAYLPRNIEPALISKSLEPQRNTRCLRCPSLSLRLHA